MKICNQIGIEVKWMTMQPFSSAQSCACFNDQHDILMTEKSLGMDRHYAEVTLLVCPDCGTYWLRYDYEIEAFTASGRWYLGTVSPEQVTHLSAENAKAMLESLDWYFYGGSYFQGRSGRSSGKVF
jgi:hypothetical protein